ncbi:MAG: RNase adapter RapZ [Desulfurobacterium sp.]|nr:MAG: RNase adapter RapZ [Desulfurobacterium sp.]
MKREKKILILTGESGAGKSSGMRHLEDLGFYCIDNVPPSLVPSLIRLLKDNPEIEKAVLVTDIRNPSFRTTAPSMLKNIKSKHPEVEVWYFTSDKESLIKRFSETRRPHPFERYEPGKNLESLIDEEKEILEPIKALADRVIDTTGMTVHDLKRFLKEIICSGKPRLKVTILSFGFKYGLPPSADNIFDVRFLPNPHFVAELRPKTGMDKEVADYIFRFPEAKETLQLITRFIEFTLPMYEQEGKAYVTYAIGCTGGQHRSVALTELVAEKIAEKFKSFDVFVEHRELNERKKVTAVEDA